MSSFMIFSITLSFTVMAVFIVGLFLGLRLLDSTARQPEMASTFLMQTVLAMAPIEIFWFLAMGLLYFVMPTLGA